MDWGTIIAFLSLGIGLVAYAVQNHFTKNREIETREYRIRRKQYEHLVKTIVKGIHTVKTRKEQTSLDFKLEMDYATNLLYLYASGDVLRALKAYINEPNKHENFQKLISAMRDDLNIKGDFETTEVEFFTAQ